ncbi:MAG: CHRD domain-containing protein, partial [Nitrosopumilaceae archaeon]
EQADLCPGHGGHDHGNDEPEPENDMTFNATSGTISGIWDNNDTKSLSSMLSALSTDDLYFQVHTVGYPEGAIRGQIIFNNDPEVATFFATSGFGGGSSGSSSGGSGSGGGGSRSAILGPNVVMYNACSEELEGIMRIVTYNQKDRDLRVQLSFKDFQKWAINVSDEVSYQKYIEDPNEKYEYSVFDARFPTDLEKVFVGLHDTKNKKRFIHHLVEFESNSCMGSDLPLPLKDRDATLLRPFEPLEIPEPETIEPSPFEILVSYEGRLAQQTFSLITEHKPIFQKFEDPNSLTYVPMPWNDSWNEEKQCFEIGERNRHHCIFNDKYGPQIAIAQEKFAEITWSEPVRQNFDEKKYYDKIYRGAIWLVED